MTHIKKLLERSGKTIERGGELKRRKGTLGGRYMYARMLAQMGIWDTIPTLNMPESGTVGWEPRESNERVRQLL